MQALDQIIKGTMSQSIADVVDADHVRRPSAAQMVYAALRQRIISMDLAPNQPLSRNALTEEYNVSQTPVREAILRLEQEGLVRTIPQSRTLVTRINVRQLRESHFLRSAIEIEVVHALAGSDPAPDLHQVHDILARQRGLGGNRNRRIEFARLDRQFHDSLYVVAGQPGLVDLIRERTGHLDRLRHMHLPTPGKMAKIVADHDRILAAIAARDPMRAAAEIRKHLSDSVTVIDTMIAAEPDFFDLS